MTALRRIWMAASAGLVLGISILGGANASLAEDLDWQERSSASPAAFQEPIGDRIDSPPSGSQVAPASAQERLAPGQWSPNRQNVRGAAFERGAPWQASPGSTIPGYQQSPRAASVPWQNPARTGGEPRMAARTRVIQGPATYAPDGPMSEGIAPGEIIESGDGPYVEGMPGEIIEGDGFGSGDGCGECGGCGDDCDDCCLLSCPKCPPGCIPAPEWPKNIDLLVGVQGFKGALDQGRNGNFGFHEGFNVGGHLWLTRCVSWQLGGTWTQQNFHGDQTPGFYRDETRQQVFGTAGLFVRADSCLPWQGGVVIDGLHDDYGGKYNVGQVRAEISRVGCFGNEFGFMGAFHVRDDEVDLGTVGELQGIVTLQTVDQYCLFVRTRFDNCGEGRIWGGVSGDGDGIFGADYRIPLSDSFLIQGNFNYLITNESNQLGQRDEAWGISLELVFQPFCRARRSMSDRNRPLFNVADNGRMFVEPK